MAEKQKESEESEKKLGPVPRALSAFSDVACRYSRK